MCSPRPDLSDHLLSNPDLVLFLDGPATGHPVSGLNLIGFAVVSVHAVLCSGSLPSHYFAQTAELVALTEACKLAAGKSVTIYTDSRYAFGVVHDFGALWKHRKFLKSDGKPILNHSHVAALLYVIFLPTSVAIYKCKAHTSYSNDMSCSNAKADAAARLAAERGRCLHFPPFPSLLRTSHPHFWLCKNSPLQMKNVPGRPVTVAWRIVYGSALKANPVSRAISVLVMLI